MNWFEPIDIWDLFGINSREEFVVRHVVEGKFHKDVPEDISKSFVTVSYLLAHSYYHLPMFDEAFSKALLIMEMAVKLKAKQLNIDLKLPANKKGVVYDKKLSKIIDEICLNDELSFLKPDFDRARNLRNRKMHPDRHSFAGTFSLADSNIRLFGNIINLLFLEKEALKALHKDIKQMETKLSPFKKGLQVLEFQNKKILIDGFHMFKYRDFNNIKLLMFFVNPLTTKVHEQFVEHKFPKPLIITFTDFKINKDSIEGVDLDNKSMKIYTDDKEQNLKTYADYIIGMSKVSESDIHLFSSSNSGTALWKMEEIIYKNCWSNNKEKLELS
mgnify:CR=1 FL=1